MKRRGRGIPTKPTKPAKSEKLMLEIHPLFARPPHPDIMYYQFMVRGRVQTFYWNFTLALSTFYILITFGVYKKRKYYNHNI